jgi:hypothetical protein
MRIVTTFLLCSTVLATRSSAQFGISGDVQLGVYGGASRDTSPGNLGQSFRPHRPVLFTLRPEWEFGRLRVALGVSYGRPDIVEDGEPLAIVLHAPSQFVELAPELSYQIWRSPASTRVRLHAGPVLNIWQLPGEDRQRNRGGGFAAMSLEFPILARLQAALRASAVLTSGVFDGSDLPPEFEIRSMRRVGISLGVRYGR